MHANINNPDSRAQFGTRVTNGMEMGGFVGDGMGLGKTMENIHIFRVKYVVSPEP